MSPIRGQISSGRRLVGAAITRFASLPPKMPIASKLESEFTVAQRSPADRGTGASRGQGVRPLRVQATC